MRALPLSLRCSGHRPPPSSKRPSAAAPYGLSRPVLFPRAGICGSCTTHASSIPARGARLAPGPKVPRAPARLRRAHEVERLKKKTQLVGGDAGLKVPRLGESGALPLNLPSGLLRRFGVGREEALHQPRGDAEQLGATGKRPEPLETVAGLWISAGATYRSGLPLFFRLWTLFQKSSRS